MKEKDVTRRVLELCKRELGDSAAIEVKLCKKGSISFDVLAEHQKKALWYAKHSVLVFKIPDMGYRNPFDAFMIKEGMGVVVVVFWLPRNLLEAIVIDIDTWIHASESERRKSLTLEWARDIGTSYTL